MANLATRLQDVYNPVDFVAGVQEAQVELNRFIQSGIVTPDPRFMAFANEGGTLNEVAFLKPLGINEPNYSTDDIATHSETKRLTGDKMQVRTAFMNESWQVTDLAQELALAKPMAGIINRVGKFWATNSEKRLIQSCLGVAADSVANHSSDMVNDISTQSTVADANRVSANAIIDTVQTLGDHGENLSAIAMHSAIYRNLQKLNLIDFIPDASGQVDIPTYQGKRVIVDDSLVATAETNPVYTVQFFASGAFVSGIGSPENPEELYRDPSAGNGGGSTKLFSRVTEICHPLGMSATGAPAGQSYTYTELASAATWSRVFERKNIPLAFLKVNA